MSKTLLKHFTFIETATSSSLEPSDMPNDSLADLVSELQQVIQQAKTEMLSPRKKVIDDILSQAKLS